MHTLTARDIAEVRDAAHAIADSCFGPEHRPWNEAALVPMSRVMRSEIVAHHRLVRTGGVWTAEIRPYPVAAHLDAVPEVLDDHPLVTHYRTHPDDLSTLRLSHFYDERQLRGSPLYRLILKPLGTPRFIAIPAAFTASTGDGFGLTRSGRDYGEREEAVGDALQSLLAALRHRDLALQTAARRRTPPQLTDRENEVAELLGEGLTAFSIGRILGISPRTVQKHLENLYAKLGVNDRVSAARAIEAWRRARGEPSAAPAYRVSRGGPASAP